MRPITKNRINIIDESSANAFPVKFTADAIRHLSGLNGLFDIKEWVWHIEIINGEKHCIVTDKLQRQLLQK